MVRWKEADFTQRAKELAERHVTTKASLDDLAEKVAREEDLVPDEIRTLVRLSNVATFQELFRLKDAGDKMIEFEVGDAEAVIRRIVTEEPPVPATVDNDKLASEIPDQMRERRLGQKFDPPMEKVAEEAERLPRTDSVILALRKLAADLEVERVIYGRRWEEKLATLVPLFRRAAGYGPKWEEFEKDAYAEHGLVVQPELAFLREELHLPMRGFPSEKVASLQERRVTTDTPELGVLTEAVTARDAFEKISAGLRWIEKNTPTL